MSVEVLGLLVLLPVTSLCFSSLRGPASSSLLAPIQHTTRHRHLTTLTSSLGEALNGEYSFGDVAAKNGTDDVLPFWSRQQLILANSEKDKNAQADEGMTLFYEMPQSEALALTTSSATTTPTIAVKVNNRPYSLVLNDVWKARLLLLLSAALYGTTFSVVKSLDEIIPVAVTSTLRFGLAAIAMLPMLLAPLSDEFENSIKNDDDGASPITYAFMEPSRLSVGLAGMEIGLWNSIGYISQAVGLRTTAASTVRKQFLFEWFICVCGCLVFFDLEFLYVSRTFRAHSYVQWRV